MTGSLQESNFYKGIIDRNPNKPHINLELNFVEKPDLISSFVLWIYSIICPDSYKNEKLSLIGRINTFINQHKDNLFNLSDADYGLFKTNLVTLVNKLSPTNTDAKSVFLTTVASIDSMRPIPIEAILNRRTWGPQNGKTAPPPASAIPAATIGVKPAVKRSLPDDFWDNPATCTKSAEPCEDKVTSVNKLSPVNTDAKSLFLETVSSIDSMELIPIETILNRRIWGPQDAQTAPPLTASISAATTCVKPSVIKRSLPDDFWENPAIYTSSQQRP